MSRKGKKKSGEEEELEDLSAEVSQSYSETLKNPSFPLASNAEKKKKKINEKSLLI